jgi:hypothetical protein
VAGSNAIPMAQAEAREKLWTPEDEGKTEAGIVTPDTAGKDAPAGKLWTPGDPK